MIRPALITTICFLLLTSAALAQSVDGKWTTGLRARAPDGRVITLTLKSDGSKVTGTMYGIQPIPLEGTIDGKTLRITLNVTTATGSVLPVNYTGILEGDEIKFTYQSQTGQPPVFGPNAREFVAKRME